MRVAALYDIHGNLPALEAVLEDVRSAHVDLIVVGGDVVPGPMPRETLHRLLELATPLRFIAGNGEREVLAFRAGIETATVPDAFRAVVHWNAAALDDADAAAIASWPATLSIEVPEVGRVLFCHATPHSDTDIFTRLSPDGRLEALLGDVAADVLVCGHTHMPFDRLWRNVRIVNAGSVGMPFGPPGASWLLLGPGIEPRHTRYDGEAAAARIRATDYPQAADFAVNNVLSPPTEEAILAAWARVDGREE